MSQNVAPQTDHVPRSPLEAGSRVYYTGDMANVSGWFTVTGQRTADSYDLKECDGDGREFLGVRHIGHEYHGHCNPRFVTESAVLEYRRMREAACGAHERRPCHERIAGTQNLCTRDAGHEGAHRCSAADVDARHGRAPIARRLPCVTVNFEPWGEVEIFYDAAPAEPGNDYPGYFDIVAVKFGQHDILDELQKRSHGGQKLADWIKECALERLAESAARAREEEYA